MSDLDPIQKNDVPGKNFWAAVNVLETFSFREPQMDGTDRVQYRSGETASKVIVEVGYIPHWEENDLHDETFQSVRGQINLDGFEDPVIIEVRSSNFEKAHPQSTYKGPRQTLIVSIDGEMIPLQIETVHGGYKNELPKESQGDPMVGSVLSKLQSILDERLQEVDSDEEKFEF